MVYIGACDDNGFLVDDRPQYSLIIFIILIEIQLAKHSKINMSLEGVTCVITRCKFYKYTLNQVKLYYTTIRIHHIEKK